MEISYFIKRIAVFDLCIESNLLKWRIIKLIQICLKGYDFKLHVYATCRFGDYKIKVIFFSVCTLIKILFCLSCINHICEYQEFGDICDPMGITFPGHTSK